MLCLPFLGRSPRRYAEIALLALIVATASYTGRVSDAAETVWSPYQKIALRNSAADGPSLLVNNVDYQGLLDLSEANVSARPERFPPELRGYSQYDLPMRLHASPREVLMVGAGSGNDAAGALRNGALHVTAVEIDPAIIRFGRDHHPEQPYQRPEVRVVVDDARSFFVRTQQRYDVIVFGLLDSHTTHAMTNARLDHYVYTQESLSRARSLLAPGGILVLSFEAQKPYIASRIARTLTEEFGREPLAFRVPASAYGWGGVLFVSGDADARAGVTTRLREDSRLGAHVERWRLAPAVLADHATRITTDDWPYLYLPRPTIPALYALLAGLLVVVFVLGARLAGWPRLTGGFGRAHMHFFALGAAFLLLEVQNISKACVALGNTWWVNAVVISGVLVMVLLANWTAARFPKLPLPVVFVCLLATCAGLYFLDLSQFGGLPYGAKALLVGGVTTTPMFFAGIVFVRSFAGAPHKDEALGANLVGSLVGALLQSITFLSGVRFLLWIVAAFYVVAWATRPKER